MYMAKGIDVINEFKLSFRQWAFQIQNGVSKLSFLADLEAPYAYKHNEAQLNGLNCLVSFVENDGGFINQVFIKKSVSLKSIGMNANSSVTIYCSRKNIEDIYNLAKLYKIERDDKYSIVSHDLKSGLGLNVDVEVLTHDIEDEVNYVVENWLLVTAANHKF
jgi:hypothetical protein